MKLVPTASQTVGPYWLVGLDWPGANVLAGDGTEGERIEIEGRILDGDGAPVIDAMVEIWQANAQGRYDHPEDRQDKQLDPGFKGFGRAATDNEGRFRFITVKPGPVPGPGNSLQAPHLVVAIFARGLLKQLVTRLYFPDEPLNADDPVLNLVEQPARRATIVAEAAGERRYSWTVVLQGENETVFFDC